MNDGNALSATDNCRKMHRASDGVRRARAEDRSELYLLSFLLTADRRKAEQCFLTGLEPANEDNAVFRDWMQFWARRIIINNAVRLIAPHPDTEGFGVDSIKSG